MLTTSSKQRRLTKSAYGHALKPHTVVTNEICLFHLRWSVFGTLTTRFILQAFHPQPSRYMKKKAPDEMKRWDHQYVPSIPHSLAHSNFSRWSNPMTSNSTRLPSRYNQPTHLKVHLHGLAISLVLSLSGLASTISLGSPCYGRRRSDLAKTHLPASWVLSYDQLARYHHP